MAETRQVPEWQRKVGYATNAAGMIGGPAAIWAATRNRKAGGIPRDIARSIAGTGKHQKRTKAQLRLSRAVSALDKPKSKKAAIAAGVAGSSMIGLQVANWAGDTIATRALSQQKKHKKPAGEVMAKSAFGVVHKADYSSTVSETQRLRGKAYKKQRIARHVGNATAASLLIPIVAPGPTGRAVRRVAGAGEAKLAARSISRGMAGKVKSSERSAKAARKLHRAVEDPMRAAVFGGIGLAGTGIAGTSALRASSYKDQSKANRIARKYNAEAEKKGTKARIKVSVPSRHMANPSR